MATTPRLAVRGIILIENRLLLVNVYADPPNRLWCLPGGGVEPGASLPDNLMREVYEEAGLQIRVGALALVHEFHNPADGFHQVEAVFRCTVAGGTLETGWQDPGQVVTQRRLCSQAELADLPLCLRSSRHCPGRIKRPLTRHWKKCRADLLLLKSIPGGRRKCQAFATWGAAPPDRSPGHQPGRNHAVTGWLPHVPGQACRKAL